MSYRSEKWIKEILADCNVEDWHTPRGNTVIPIGYIVQPLNKKTITGSNRCRGVG